ncbi:uncharacterized protein N7479_005334 [Penicillium vulpinum]|uniref:Uncharacterized protein n=1 Tax=Penicillium vulpinum TaxID=29845 RepID=A0A1V6RK35_9EURO|nr:uncharacterized protein N7479_005334 [Penicillium vulpinum]KAJ5958184.1 hypothetical protein N7479_005334 [Penicillium vulpinum]OQE02202.1 hypothetical protein PENVUL_c040G09527 [Penicillium vulpinum]
MSNLFCCTTIQPTKLPNPEHEQTFTEFTKWALTTIGNLTGSTNPSEASLCVQLVSQVNSGSVDSVRYFVAGDKHGNFEEISEDDVLDANFVKINECKSFICTKHNRVFDLNLYEPSTGSTRHWRSSITKPLKQIENALKHRMSGSGSGSGSGSRSVSGSRSALKSTPGSGVGNQASSSYGYGSGMGYGSGWGSHLGSGCGPDWGTGTTVFVKDGPSSTTVVETGSSDSNSNGQDQDPDQDSDKDQPLPSSPTLGDETAQDDDTDAYSARFGTQITSNDEEGTIQSYLDTEDHGCYYSGVSSHDYGSYDCGGGDYDVSYDCGDCGGCDD